MYNLPNRWGSCRLGRFHATKKFRWRGSFVANSRYEIVARASRGQYLRRKRKS